MRGTEEDPAAPGRAAAPLPISLFKLVTDADRCCAAARGSARSSTSWLAFTLTRPFRGPRSSRFCPLHTFRRSLPVEEACVKLLLRPADGEVLLAVALAPPPPPPCPRRFSPVPHPPCHRGFRRRSPRKASFCSRRCTKMDACCIISRTAVALIVAAYVVFSLNHALTQTFTDILHT